MAGQSLPPRQEFARCISIAARVISSVQRTTRRFDGCFEWDGASAVALALVRRAKRRPDTKLAQNLYRYLCPHACQSDVELYADWTDLPALAEYLCSKTRTPTK